MIRECATSLVVVGVFVVESVLSGGAYDGICVTISDPVQFLKVVEMSANAATHAALVIFSDELQTAKTVEFDTRFLTPSYISLKHPRQSEPTVSFNNPKYCVTEGIEHSDA